MAKSITALIFGRAMTQRLVGPDDPLGSLIPVADAAHGEITMRDLLTMTSGLQWNGLRDYNIFMPDRIAEALTVPVEKQPGTYWEYSQSGPALVAEATQNAVGEDFQAYAQRELFGPIGIEPGTWRWQRDSAGHTQGFFGAHMVPDDFARLGELMRRGGVWRGRRLLSKRFMRESITPIAQNGCYGWFIWLNASKPCVGPRVVDRPVSDDRIFPTLPADVYQFAGLFGQLVTVFPSQGLVVARFGQDSGSIAGGAPWEEEFYRPGARLDHRRADRVPEPKPDAGEVSREDVDRGFFEAAQHPEQYGGGRAPAAAAAAGPARARATLIELRARRPSPRGTVEGGCAARAPGPRACGRAARARPGSRARLRAATGSAAGQGADDPLRPARRASCAGSSATAGSRSRSRTRNRDRGGRHGREARVHPAPRASVSLGVAEDRAVDQPLDRGAIVGVDVAAGQPRLPSGRRRSAPACAGCRAAASRAARSSRAAEAAPRCRSAACWSARPGRAARSGTPRPSSGRAPARTRRCPPGGRR